MNIILHQIFILCHSDWLDFMEKKDLLFSILHYANNARCGYDWRWYSTCKCTPVDVWPLTWLATQSCEWLVRPSRRVSSITAREMTSPLLWRTQKSPGWLFQRLHGLVLIHTEQLAAFHYHTDGHVPMAHNVGISTSSAATPQVYPAVTCSISAPPPPPCKIQFSIRDVLNNILNCISQHQLTSQFANHQFVLWNVQQMMTKRSQRSWQYADRGQGFGSRLWCNFASCCSAAAQRGRDCCCLYICCVGLYCVGILYVLFSFLTFLSQK